MKPDKLIRRKETAAEKDAFTATRLILQTSLSFSRGNELNRGKRTEDSSRTGRSRRRHVWTVT